MHSPAITTLPFVQDRDGTRCFWAVEPTGDYTADCRTGQEYALLFLDYSARSEGGAILQLIVPDMPKEQSGIEIGFLELVSFAAAAGLPRAVSIMDYWHRCEMERAS